MMRLQVQCTPVFVSLNFIVEKIPSRENTPPRGAGKPLQGALLTLNLTLILNLLGSLLPVSRALTFYLTDSYLN